MENTRQRSAWLSLLGRADPHRSTIICLPFVLRLFTGCLLAFSEKTFREHEKYENQEFFSFSSNDFCINFIITVTTLLVNQLVEDRLRLL